MIDNSNLFMKGVFQKWKIVKITHVNNDRVQLMDFLIRQANFEYNLLMFASIYKSLELSCIKQYGSKVTLLILSE